MERDLLGERPDQHRVRARQLGPVQRRGTRVGERAQEGRGKPVGLTAVVRVEAVAPAGQSEKLIAKVVEHHGRLPEASPGDGGA
ncbi:hypothetical protein [Salana multivorans]